MLWAGASPKRGLSDRSVVTLDEFYVCRIFHRVPRRVWPLTHLDRCKVAHPPGASCVPGVLALCDLLLLSGVRKWVL